MQSTKALILLLALAACTPAVPNSGAGVGFGDYNDYLRQREMGQGGASQNYAGQTNAGQAGTMPSGNAPTGFSADRVGAALDNAANGPQTGRVIGQTLPDGTGAARTMSDEQDFNAVSARESIESDAERLARLRSQYAVVTPTALPQRTGGSGPNIVQFALSTNHAPGVQMYKRGSLFKKDPVVACAQYTSPDLAQEAFLSMGGPAKDKKGLDPDGDGFACGWDPRPFRTALQ